MFKRFAGAACAAAVVAIGTVAFAENTQQAQPPTSAQPPAQAADQKSDMKDVTIIGCVQSEKDYRAANNLGGGGAAGTGVGAGNEFVLINASISPSAVGTAGATKPETGAPAGTAAFELTGSKESEASAFVGKRVEIVGKMKAAEIGATGPTGGATAGKPPTGVDVASKDLKLREVEITSIKEASGTCPAK
jgi:hypothetical protein